MTETPFKLQFTTDNHPNGTHTIYAIATLDDGRELRYNDQADMGKVYVTSPGATAAIPGFDTQGIDVVSDAFTFEAFDENWKGGPEPDDAEKHWGFFRADRTPKPAVAALDSRPR